MRRLTAAALFLGLVCTARAQDDAAKKIEGSYEVVSATRGGKPDKKAEEVKSFTIKDGMITINDGGREQTVKYALDPSKKPAEIAIVDGPRTIRGIYQTKDTDKGLELTIAFSRGKGSDIRPKDFKGEGEDDVVLKLLRKKPK